MPDDNASTVKTTHESSESITTSHHSWSRRHVVLVALASIGISAVVLTLVFVAARIQKTDMLEAKVAQLETLNNDMMLKCTGVHDDFGARLDLVEQVLFGDIKPKVDRTATGKLPVSRIEATVISNERELRRRVEALERWRLRMID